MAPDRDEWDRILEEAKTQILVMDPVIIIIIN